MAAGQQRGRKGAHQKLTPEQLRALRSHLAEISDEQVVLVGRTRETDEHDTASLTATSKQLRAEGDLSPGTSYRVTRGPWNPTLASLLDLATKLGVHVVHLVGFGDEPIDRLLRTLRRWEPRQLDVLVAAVCTLDRNQLVDALAAMVARGRTASSSPTRSKP